MVACTTGPNVARTGKSNVLLRSIRESFERGRAVIDREVALRDLQDCDALLTPRERQVMALAVSGLLNKQVRVGAQHW